MMRYSHFARIGDPGAFRRILGPEQVCRAHAMRERGMTWAAIAAWFTRNGTPISYAAVRDSCARESSTEGRGCPISAPANNRA